MKAVIAMLLPWIYEMALIGYVVGNYRGRWVWLQYCIIWVHEVQFFSGIRLKIHLRCRSYCIYLCFAGDVK